MSRARYWKLTPDEVSGFDYPTDKLLNWDIKCVKQPEEAAIFAGVFMYRHGTPMDYDSIKGMAYYHNHMPENDLGKINGLLKDTFGGEVVKKGDRVFLRDSSEIYSGPDIAGLARQLEDLLDATATITLEFSDFDEQEMTQAGLPPSKLLPIPSK